MPKAPILNRMCFYTRRPDGSVVEYDWNLVNTSLGAMVEPRQMSLHARDGLVQIDLDDISHNERRLLDDNTAPAILGTAGNQLPADYNTQ